MTAARRVARGDGTRRCAAPPASTLASGARSATPRRDEPLQRHGDSAIISRFCTARSATDDGTRQELRAPRDRGALVSAVGSARAISSRSMTPGRARVLHPAAAAERHRHAAHGPRVPADADGRADPLPPHARLQHALAARHRPRRHRHADRGRAPAQGAGHSRATTSAARRSSSACGSGRRSRARRSRARCAASAPRPTGRASASRWTKACRARCVEIFVRLYEEGLIYRGKRLVNWDPVLGTAVSDLEVESEEEHGKLWQIRYPLADGSRLAWSSRRRAPRRCSATSRSRCIRTTSATGTSSASTVRLPLSEPHDPGHRRRLRRPRIRHRLREDHAGARLQRLRRSASATSCR